MGSSTKVLLCYPQPTLSSPQRSPCLSILHVGEALKQAKMRGKSGEDYAVRYYDARWDDPPDMDWPDVVGVSAMTGHQISGAISLLKAAKAKGKRTILGGIHASTLPEQCLQEDCVDSVVVGEGEWAVIEAIHGGPKQVVHAVNLRTEDMVSPVSPETLVHFRRSARTGDTTLMTSRGCPYSCSFCYIVSFFHKNSELWWAKVDLEQWKRDVLYLRDHAGVRRLEHSDDWVGPTDRLFEILEFLKEAGIQYRPSIRAHQIDDDVARRMKELGVEHLSVGIETASPRILRLVKKGNDLPDLVRCVESLAKHDLWPLLYYITNFPTETQAEINQTLDFSDWAHRQFRGRVTQNYYSYLPLPGNPLWDMVDKSALPHDMAGWSTFSLNQTSDEQSTALYWIGGLVFHRGKGDKTDRNFSGLARLLILPFELLAMFRWKTRWFSHFGSEKRAIDWLMRWASLRYENSIRKGRFKSLREVEAMDFGVVEHVPDIGARGEFGTGDIEK